MIGKSLAAAVLLLAPLPAYAQSEQDALDDRYDHALAAGYKALFLCSAIANAERNGATRTPESVHEWELTGIQAPLNAMVQDLEAQFYRDESSAIYAVAVSWDSEAIPRVALHNDGSGCAVQPIGYEPAFFTADEPAPPEAFYKPDAMVVQTSHPLTEGALHDVGEAAFDDSAFGVGTRTTAVIVRANGRDLISRSVGDFPNVVATPQRTWSVAKSIASTLIGAAVYREEADVTASAGLGESENDPRRAITIDHVLRMASGRYSDTPGNRTDPLYFGGSTVDETALGWPLVHKPGSVYRYANNDTLAAVKAIEHTFVAYPPAEFFAQLGMNATIAETDWKGNYVLSSQVWSTARDLATLGQLYLDNGVLPNGTRILPENWREYVSSPSGPQPEGRGIGYGAGFWLFNQSEGIPPDTFAAMGNRGQYVVIVPSRDVVIVRRGEDPAGHRFDIIAFTRDVLAALDE